MVRTCGTTGKHSRRIAERDWRDRRDARVRGLKFEVFGTSNHELRVAPFAHVSHFTRHALWLLADFFSILLGLFDLDDRLALIRSAI